MFYYTPCPLVHADKPNYQTILRTHQDIYAYTILTSQSENAALAVCRIVVYTVITQITPASPSCVKGTTVLQYRLFTKLRVTESPKPRQNITEYGINLFDIVSHCITLYHEVINNILFHLLFPAALTLDKTSLDQYTGRHS